jgi:UDP-2,3-diacylglucosamine pyrophosphatase LpxH
VTCAWARPAARQGTIAGFFLKRTQRQLYLVGDITWTAGSCGVNGSGRRRTSDVVQKLSSNGRAAASCFVPGNHDEVPGSFDNHTSSAALKWWRPHHRRRLRQLWVIRGDYFDAVRQMAGYVGDNLYEFTLKLNRHLNSLRARMGLPYWSLSAYLKQRSKAL